jgi:hypothetical protein
VPNTDIGPGGKSETQSNSNPQQLSLVNCWLCRLSSQNLTAGPALRTQFFRRNPQNQTAVSICLPREVAENGFKAPSSWAELKWLREQIVFIFQKPSGRSGVWKMLSVE